MTLRLHLDHENARDVNAMVNRTLSRIYFLWLLGVLVASIGLKPTEFNAFGASYTVERPDLVPGIIFVAVVVLYIGVFGRTFLEAFATEFMSRPYLRRAIWLGSGSRKTLRNATPAQRLAIRTVARGIYRGMICLLFFVYFLPLAHILLFERSALFDAVAVIFTGDTSTS